MTATDKMLARKDGRVGTMIFNNPERHNAVSLEMWQAARRILDDFAQRRRGARRGADGRRRQGLRVGRRHLQVRGRARHPRGGAALQRHHRAVLFGHLRLPEADHRRHPGLFASAAASGWPCRCDLRFCTQGSRFALPAARLGLGYGFDGLQRFINTIGPSHTKDIFFSARQFGADEALRMGVVSRVVPDGELDAFVKEYADTIAANAPLTVGAIKQITTEVLKPESERNLARAAELVARCFASQDYIEGRTAFMEKRKPQFTGK